MKDQTSFDIFRECVSGVLIQKYISNRDKSSKKSGSKGNKNALTGFQTVLDDDNDNVNDLTEFSEVRLRNYLDSTVYW